jgi:hypothetical protein
MYFKPRIFISSSLKLDTIRQKIYDFFESVGAEVMLYEKNLTPSINQSTYRQDILESDFVIFIFDKFYGSKTTSGKSGTHEEWEIAQCSKIPGHVYIKKNKDKKRESSLNKFLSNEINNNYVSYYRYKTEEDLLNQIKFTTFTIAKEIALKKIDIKNISPFKIKQLMIESDYKLSMDFLKGIEELIEQNKTIGIDFLKTTILTDYISPYESYLNSGREIFIDSKHNELFSNVIIDFNNFYNSHYKQFTSQKMKTTYLKSLDLELNYSELSRHEKCDYNELNALLKKILESIDIFKKRVFSCKNNYDIKDFI